MSPSKHFSRHRRPRSGVSELYASMLMVGVTLSVGGLVSVAAMGQFGLAADSASLGATLEQSSAGVQLGLVYTSVLSSSTCPTYGGYTAGTSLTQALYDYGTSDYTPVTIVVNSTAYSGNYATMGAGSLAAYTITLTSCAHPPGQTIVAFDSSGNEVDVES